MTRSRFRRNGGPRFVMLQHWVLDSAAWKDLDPVARALYVELKRKFNGTNNGTIGYGVRAAADDLNVHRNTANRAFQALEEHGFISRAKEATFHQKKMTIDWLLADEPDGRNGHGPTKQFMRWSPTGAGPLGRQKKQNPVPPQGQPVPQQGLSGKQIPHLTHNSPSQGTIVAAVTAPQSLPRDTYTSSHRQGAAQGAVVAGPHVAGVNEGEPAGGFSLAGDAAANVIAKLRGAA